MTETTGRAIGILADGKELSLNVNALIGNHMLAIANSGGGKICARSA